MLQVITRSGVVVRSSARKASAEASPDATATLKYLGEDGFESLISDSSVSVNTSKTETDPLIRERRLRRAIATFVFLATTVAH